jgi:bifunctional ADP-heptose synthase (sugar kinase/adenylyltransferase)
MTMPTTAAALDADAARLLAIIDRFARQRILVMGDFIADEFIYGRVARVSREAPVLILEYDKTQIVPGGAGNAANNVAALGARTRAIGLIGQDDAGSRFIDALHENVDRRSVIVSRAHSTPTKTRILAGGVHSAKQQVVRIDRGTQQRADATVRADFRDRALRAVAGCDAVLVSDYGAGLITPSLVRDVRRALNGRSASDVANVGSRAKGPSLVRRGGAATTRANVAARGPVLRGGAAAAARAEHAARGGAVLRDGAVARAGAAGAARGAHARSRIPVLVDSRYVLDQYRGLTACTPNESEVEALLGITIDENLPALEKAGRELLTRTGNEIILITRGSHGMALFEPNEPTRHIEIFGTDEIADVTGAGDTVIATMTLALAAGASAFDAACLANYAGGTVVMKRGTATVSVEELRYAVMEDAKARAGQTLAQRHAATRRTGSK